MPFRILIAHFSLAFNNISCLNIPLFINSPTEGHLGCFQFLTIMNKTNVKLHGRLRPAHLSVAERSYPMSEVRGRNQEDPMPEGWWPEELPHVRGQGRQPREATPHPHAWGQGRQLGGATPRARSSGCVDGRGPRGAIPRWRSGRAAVRRYPLSKVRNSGCTLLEQPWRDTPHPR